MLKNDNSKQLKRLWDKIHSFTEQLVKNGEEQLEFFVQERPFLIPNEEHFEVTEQMKRRNKLQEAAILKGIDDTLKEIEALKNGEVITKTSPTPYEIDLREK